MKDGGQSVYERVVSYCGASCMLVLEAPAGMPCLCRTRITTCSSSGLKLSKSNTFLTTLPMPSVGYAYDSDNNVASIIHITHSVSYRMFWCGGSVCVSVWNQIFHGQTHLTL